MPELQWMPFEIRETRDPDHVLVSVQGELDVVVAEELEEHLDRLTREHEAVRLDLSRLQFIDSSGLRVILRAVLEARKHGLDFDVERNLSPQVQRVFELVQAERLLWPAD
jgi:anti-anti-sigma factor